MTLGGCLHLYLQGVLAIVMACPPIIVAFAVVAIFIRRRPPGARQLSVRRADRPHRGRRASPQALLHRAARAYAAAIRRVPAGSPGRIELATIDAHRAAEGRTCTR